MMEKMNSRRTVRKKSPPMSMRAPGAEISIIDAIKSDHDDLKELIRILKTMRPTTKRKSEFFPTSPFC